MLPKDGTLRALSAAISTLGNCLKSMFLPNLKTSVSAESFYKELGVRLDQTGVANLTGWRERTSHRRVNDGSLNSEHGCQESGDGLLHVHLLLVCLQFASVSG